VAIAKIELPLIRQIHNACGITSILMALKPDKNNELDAFFRKLEKRLTKSLKISTDTFGFLDRVQFATAWLMLQLMFDTTTHGSFLAGIFPDIENVRSLLESRLDEMVIYQKTCGNARIVKDLEKMTRDHEITLNIIESYLQEQKTDAELKFLGSLFGLVFASIPENDGGTQLGTISHVDPRRPEEYATKLGVLARQLASGAVLANYEYHWLALREIGKRLDEFTKQESSAASIDAIVSTPHYFKLNNPLSSTVLTLKDVAALEKYTFYCFDFKIEQQKVTLAHMRDALNL
jgi:hypothetical protein